MDQISLETRALLERFAQGANWKTSMWASDMELFFDFVIAAYRNGEHAISQDVFLDIVKEVSKKNVSGIERELASKVFMFHKYEEGIALLKKFDMQT